MSKKPEYTYVNPASHTLARAQAQSLAAQAIAAGTRAKSAPLGRDIEHVLTLLIIGGLAIELYLKAFMIAARRGHVRKGHNLRDLLSEFPAQFRTSFSDIYAARIAAGSKTYKMIALQISPSTPKTPAGAGPNLKFGTFDDAMDSLSNCFVQARYLFEDVKDGAWSFIPFPFDQIVAAFAALEETYQKLESGGFRNTG
jgi:hypothetical protein